jgi:hypothetical protein
MDALGWLADTPDGHRIAKIDPHEAGDMGPFRCPPPTEPDEPDVAAIDLLAHVVDSTAPVLAEETARLEVAGDVAGIAALLSTLRRCRTTLGFIESEAEGALARVMPEKIVIIDGVGVLERRSGKKRTAWDHRRVAFLLAARVADRRVDPDTGEVMPPGVLAGAVTEEILGCAGISYWRVGALRDRNLDPSDYCEENPGRPSVQIRESE